MSLTATYVIGEGILRIPRSEGETGRFGAVALGIEDGWTMLTGIPKGVKAELVAVKLKTITATRRRWFRPGTTVRTKTVEIPILLGTGTVFTASFGAAPTPDAVGVKPDRPSPAPWLDVTALKEVAGQWVRLELRRTAELRAEEDRHESRKEA